MICGKGFLRTTTRNTLSLLSTLMESESLWGTLDHSFSSSLCRHTPQHGSIAKCRSHTVLYRHGQQLYPYTHDDDLFISRASTISLTPNFHTHIYFLSLERPGWDSNSCFQSMVISAWDHYATTPLLFCHYHHLVTLIICILSTIMYIIVFMSFVILIITFIMQWDAIIMSDTAINLQKF